MTYIQCQACITIKGSNCEKLLLQVTNYMEATGYKPQRLVSVQTSLFFFGSDIASGCLWIRKNWVEENFIL